MTDPASRPWRLYLLLLLVMLIWSLNFIATKVVLKEVPGPLLAGIRIPLAAMFLLPVYFWSYRTHGKTWSNADALRMGLLGLVGIAANQVLFILGMGRTTVTHAGLIIGMVPLIVLTLTAILGHESLSLQKIGGIVLALGGLGILQARAGTVAGPTFWGDLMSFGSAFAFSCYVVFGKAMVVKHGPFIPTTFAFFAGALALFPTTLYFGWNFDFSKVSLAAWCGILYMALASSVIASILYYHVLGKLSASRVSSFSYLQPLMASTLGITLLGEHVSTALIGGGVLILSGVFLTERG